ncbi:hypothetical protein EYR40_005845 [Pleurotus pulmonarius]|nr:hypothetical protein EYR40_005845 [Pleurotus pulmonarius]
MELDIVISSRPPKSRGDATEAHIEILVQDASNAQLRSMPVLQKECSYPQFDSFWSRGLPVVVRSSANLHGAWSLPGLASILSGDTCEVLDCENPQYVKTSTVDVFLKEMANPSRTALDAPVLKLKDYPRQVTSKRGASEVTPSLNDYHVYLTPTNLVELRKLGIVPFTFDQHERDAVLVPAGCPYQILNLAPCVNVSLNFLAPQSLKRCAKTYAHFRASSGSEDTSQFGLLLIHSWMSLSAAEGQLGDEPPKTTPNKCPDPDFKLAPAKFRTETLLKELAATSAAEAEAVGPDEDCMATDTASTSSPTPSSVTKPPVTPAQPPSPIDPEFKAAVKYALYQLGIPIPEFMIQGLPQYPFPEHYIPYNYLHPFNFHYPPNTAPVAYPPLPTATARPLPHQLAMPLPIPMPYSGNIGTDHGPSIHTWDSSIPLAPQNSIVKKSSTRSLALDPSESDTSILRIKTFDRVQRRQRRCHNCSRPYPECQGSRKRDECSMKPNNVGKSK